MLARTTCRSAGGRNYTNGFEMLFKSIDWKKEVGFGQLLIVRDVKDTERKSRRVARSQKDLLCKDTQNVLDWFRVVGCCSYTRCQGLDHLFRCNRGQGWVLGGVVSAL